MYFVDYTSLLGDHNESEPPDPISNSEVKPLSADDSVAVCHVKVGNCQALKSKTRFDFSKRVFLCLNNYEKSCSISDSELYERLLNEFPDWLKLAKNKKLIA